MKARVVAAWVAMAWAIAGFKEPAEAQTPGTAPFAASPPAASPTAEVATRPVIGPPPPWVMPIALPAAPAGASEAPVRVMLHDQQASLEAERQTTYTEIALKIQTPEGLAAGNISLPWRPETDVLTVHKLLIRRGDEVIDVLASGQTFTVIRREQNLENAVLDGVLTANVQPEGLQVGDILHLAYSRTVSDPVLKDHVEQVGAVWNVLEIQRAHLSVQWPDGMQVDRRVSSALPQARLVRRGGIVKFDLSLDNVKPVPPPRRAPPRFALGRIAEFTSFRSWADLGALLAPLYERAAVAPADGPLRAEISRIRDLSPDPVVRAEAALALVQNRIRYVALAMGEGGLVPADATTTWARRFGDCKAKTALLLAILHELDIQAEPAAVSSVFGDGLDQRLPMIGLFNHVLVRASIAGKTYWLDGTRNGDKRLADLEVPDFHWGLPLVAQGASLVRMEPSALETPDDMTSVAIDASAGVFAPAPIHAERVVRGDAAVAGNVAWTSLSSDVRERALREYWREQLEDVEIDSVSAAFDPAAREQRFVMDGRIRMNWRAGRYEPGGTRVGYRADFSRDPGPGRDAPFTVAHPYYGQTIETIKLPPDRVFRIDGGGEVNQSAAGVVYRRTAAIAGNVFRVEKSERSVASEFPAADAPTAQATLRALADRTVRLVAPADYRPTEADLAAMTTTTPVDAAGFLRRGNVYLDGSRFDEALADFDRAVALDARNAMALAHRGLTYVWKNDTRAATRDLDAAAAIDPNNLVVFRARGLMAKRANAMSDAIAAFSRALEISPGDPFSLVHRAEAYNASGDDERALADAAAALVRNPRWTNLYLLRANIFKGRGDTERASAEAAALAAAAPDDAYALVVAGRIYAETDRQADAMREFDRAIAIKPEGYIYMNRARSRPDSDRAGRRADVDRALELSPDLIDAVVFKAELLEGERDYQGAIRTLTEALSHSPNNRYLLTRRGLGYVRMGRQRLAEADFAAARAQAVSASDLNNMCWTKATTGLALESALSDCDAALKQTPDNPHIIDSRAFVLLRLDRIDEAIAAYDRALSLSPRLPTSLFGRGLAWERKGDQAKAAADIAAAVEISSGVRAQFERYGLSSRQNPGQPSPGASAAPQQP